MLIFLAPFYSCMWEEDDDGNVSTGLYHTPDELNIFLNSVNQNYPDITLVETIGYSVLNKEIKAIIISDNPEESEMEPRVRLTGDVHGDEKITGELLIQFIDYITENYNSNSAIKDLIDNRYIVIIPMLNPDAVSADSRYNANGIDLNRNFDAVFIAGGTHGSSSFSESESIDFKDYSLETVFHLSATYHSGAVIVNMPFDYAESSTDKPNEDILVQHLGKAYSISGTFLLNEDLLSGSYVDEGTVFGGDWYVINGSLQDWSYLKSGCIDMTIEVADDSPESDFGINEVFQYNKNSMLAYIDEAGIGVYGRITDAVSGDPLTGVEVEVTDGDFITESYEGGYYHRVLLPGTYEITFSIAGYYDSDQNIVVSDVDGTLELNVTLNEL